MDERFRKTGFSGWSEYEILEYILYSTIKRADTAVMAHELIMKFGNLENVINEDMSELIKIKGIGVESARHLVTLGEFLKYYLTYTLEIPDKFDISTKATVNYIKRQFFEQKNELFIMICLDPNDKLIKTETLFEGDFISAELDIRKITRAVVGCKAAKVIFAHNHPSGNISPSKDDKNTTAALIDAMRACGVDLIEHFIVTKKDIFKLVESVNADYNNAYIRFHS